MKPDFQKLFTKARLAGLAAGTKSVPVPMVVQAVDGFGADARVIKTYEPVMDGVCGFAWIKVRPGNSSFARWLKLNKHVSGRAYGGGVDIWVSDFNQSLARKEAYAQAFAEVLKKAGIEAYAASRMD